MNELEFKLTILIQVCISVLVPFIVVPLYFKFDDWKTQREIDKIMEDYRERRMKL